MANQRTARRAIRGLSALIVAAVVLAGCSDSGNKDDASPQPSASVTDEPTGITDEPTAISEEPTELGVAPTSLGDEPIGRNPFAGNDAWIAYQTDRSGGESIWLVHPDGSDDHELEIDLPFDALLPDWSPDGKRLVFTTRGGVTEPLYELTLATGEVKQLFACEAPCLGDDEPTYSPDGTEVAFVRVVAPSTGEESADCGLWVGDVASGRVRQLSSNPDPPCDREYFVRWSPDGKQLAYHREFFSAKGQPQTAVFTLRADGTGERRLTKPSMAAGAPAYSPDGKWIVFSTYPLNAFSDGDSELYRIHPDGTGLEQLTRFSGVRATQPRYTPTGKWIIFTAVTPSFRVLAAVRADGGGKPVLLAGRGDIYTHGAWQPTS